MSVPDPATTEWVPLQGTRLDGMTYWGTYEATRTYYDGDCVIAANGILYMCVKDGTVGTAPSIWPGRSGPQGATGPQGPQGVGVPMPVVNGQWIKGVGGAAVWSSIFVADVPQLPATKTDGLVTADTAWHVIGAGGEIAFQNGWTNYGAPFGPVQYRKLASGLVIFHGLATAAGTANGIILSLPAGWRPAASRQYIFDAANSSAKYDEAFRISGDGNLTSSVVGGWISFANITYYAEA